MSMSSRLGPSQPVAKHRSFSYRTEIAWAGGRGAIAHADGLPQIRIASPPEFKGEAGVWTPEHLLIAAVNACTMTTFMAFAHRIGLPVVSYSSTAEGFLEFVDGTYRFTRVVVRPHIAVVGAEAVEQARRTIEDAHESCFIANSLRATVAVEPQIEAEPEVPVPDHSPSRAAPPPDSPRRDPPSVGDRDGIGQARAKSGMARGALYVNASSAARATGMQIRETIPFKE